MSLQSIIGLVLVLTLTLAGFSCSSRKAEKEGKPAMPPEQGKIMEKYKKSIEAAKKITVAKVNGVDISMHDLIKEMNVIGPQYIKPGQKRDSQVDEKVKKDALDRLIYRELAVQEAVRKGMKVPPENISDEFKKINANLRENLIKSGLTEEEIKKQIERNLLIEMITEAEIFGKVTIDPEQVKKTYEKKKASYKGPSGQMSLEEARPLIEKELMTLAVNKREDEWVNELKKTAKIEITLGQSAKEIHSIK